MTYRSFLHEDEFATRMQDEVLPYLHARREDGSFQTADGATLHTVYYTADEPRGCVVILHGLSEHTEKYHELCYYFLKNDLSVFLYDQRGHGHSTREVPNGIVHIHSFSQYDEDLNALLTAMADKLPTPLYLFAHSMGGAVAALYLERGMTPFEKAWLSSPAISVHTKGAPRPFVWLTCRAACVLGKGKHRIHTMSAPLPPDKETNRNSSCASRARFEALRAVKKGDPLLWSAKPSYAWLLAAMKATRRILHKKRLQNIKTPLRLYAAERDHLVELAPQCRFIADVPNGSACMIAHARHELFSERDALSHPYFEELLDYFA